MRAPFSAGVHWQADSLQAQNSIEIGFRGSNKSRKHPGSQLSASASKLHSAFENGSGIDMDVAMDYLPLGSVAEKACFWVHPDNLVEIHVLLLQFMRLKSAPALVASANSGCSPNSSSRRSRNDQDGESTCRREDDMGVIVCDDLQRFIRQQNTATISNMESPSGNPTWTAVASIRYASKGEAVVVVNPTEPIQPTSNSDEELEPQFTRLKKKAIRELFNLGLDSQCGKGQSPNDNQISPEEADSVNSYNVVGVWLSQHKSVQPLVQIQAKRTRFASIANNNISGVWATLDKDIQMRQCALDPLSHEDLLAFSDGERSSSEKFPHAILEIRFEGEDASNILAVIDESHLVSKNRKGFSPPKSVLTDKSDRKGSWILLRDACCSDAM